jgi:2-polyprenyl-3-methyl-5-hydroxy-6-metoxy-1,4-benzoquinol methylase
LQHWLFPGEPLQRYIGVELLDSVTDGELEASLRDLERINRWFGGDSVTRSLLARVVHPQEEFSVLDLGAASGASGRAIRRGFPNARVYSLDHRLRNLKGAPAPRVAADAFRLPFRAGSFDVVFCSLFLHHFDESQTAELLRSMSALARRAVIAVDLERSRIARSFLPWTRWLFGWQDITTHDGVISVKAAFSRSELEQLAAGAGLEHAQVRSHAPWFRLSLLAVPNGRNGASR